MQSCVTGALPRAAAMFAEVRPRAVVTGHELVGDATVQVILSDVANTVGVCPNCGG